MSGVAMTLDARRLTEHLREASKRCRNLRNGLRDCGEHVLTSVSTNFALGGRPTPWKPLAASTLARAGLLGQRRNAKGRRSRFTKSGKMRKGAARGMAGKKILIDTKRLKDSITYRVFAREVVIGTNVEYAATHQYGRPPIPARPFLLLQPQDKTAVRRILKEHILGVFS